jgi:phage gp45-like
MGEAAYIAALHRRIERLERLVGQAIGIGKSTAAAIDTGTVQTMQGQIDALSYRDNMPVMGLWGFSSSLPIGGDKMLVYPRGDRSQAVIIGTGHQAYRYTGLQQGETVMFDMNGHSIHLSSSGIKLIGNVSVVGSITATLGIVAGFGGADQVGLQTHEHPTAAIGGPSAPSPGT